MSSSDQIATEDSFDIESVEIVTKTFYPEYNKMMDESQFRKRSKRNALFLFNQGLYDNLDTVAKMYRTGARTGSGLFKITFFYDSFDSHYHVDEDGIIEETLAGLKEWQAAHPDSPTAFIAEAFLMRRVARCLRGHGKRTADLSARYFAQLDATFNYVQDHWDIIESDPNAHTLLMDLMFTRPQSAANWRIGFDRSRRAFPDYYPFYFVALHDGFNENGEVDIEANALELYEIMHEKTPDYGEAAYARIIWAASTDDRMFDLIRKKKIDWPKMRSGFNDILREFPDAWNLNAFARFSCISGDRKTFKKLQAKLELYPLDSIWEEEVRNACGKWAIYKGQNPFSADV